MTRRMLAEFTTADAITAAVRDMRREGYRGFETFTPFPIEELNELCDPRPSPVRTIMVVCAVAAGLLAFWMQYYSAVDAYPINSGGRPLNSWPAFMLVVFEFTVFFAAFSGLLALFWTGGLVLHLHHPRFDWEGFERASVDRFFVEIAIGQDREEARRLPALLRRHGALRIAERDW